MIRILSERGSRGCFYTPLDHSLYCKFEDFEIEA